MPSLLQLTNNALSELGQPPVSALSDSPSAAQMGRKIVQLFPELLLNTNWIFATVYINDDNPLSVNFSPDFTYTYQLPANFGTFFKWASSGAQYPSYEFVDGLLLAQTRPVQYYYIVNDAAFEIWPPLFARAVELYAASELCLVMTNNEKLTAYLRNKFEKMLVSAIKQNDIMRPVAQAPYNEFNRIFYV